MQEFSHSDSENSRYPWYRFYRKRHGIPSLPFSQTPRIPPLCKRHQTEHQEGCSGSIPEVFQLCSLHLPRKVFGPKMDIHSQRDFRNFYRYVEIDHLKSTYLPDLSIGSTNNNIGSRPDVGNPVCSGSRGPRFHTRSASHLQQRPGKSFHKPKLPEAPSFQEYPGQHGWKRSGH